MAICGDGLVTAWPSSTIRPDESACSPAIDQSRVDLPQPDGPTTQTNSPSWTSMENPSSASVRPLGVS